MTDKKGLGKLKDLFWYSDSEPNEVLIALCHLICLPMAIVSDFANAHWALMFFGIASGLFQICDRDWETE